MKSAVEPITQPNHTLTPEIEVMIVDPRLEDWGVPDYQTSLAAAIDLYACVPDTFELNAGKDAVLIPTGIAIHIGEAHIAGFILPRSGTGHRKGLILGNSVGLIDADYTGQLMISAWNRNPAGTPPIIIDPGDRIAQILFLPIARPILKRVQQFSTQTERGSQGFGSTGVTQ